jgi:predicted metalloprotease with PDZ domain
MFRESLFICLFAWLICCTHTLVALPINYEINYQNENLPSLQIKLQFTGDADGETEIALPNNFGSTQKLHRCFQQIYCSDSGTSLYFDLDTLFLRIYHSPNKKLTLTYKVIQDFKNKKLNPMLASRPIVQSDYFHILGNSLFLLPTGTDNHDITIDWKSFPIDWKLHNSLGKQQSTQHFHGNASKLFESVFVGGDFRILEAKVMNRPIYLAIRGNNWSFQDVELLEMLQKTVTTQRTFWDDFDIPFYSVTLIPIEQNLNNEDYSDQDIYYLGMGLTNSFATFASPTKSMKVSSLYHLFNHEMMHDWIGTKIRNGGQNNDMQYAWFSEGFTEYFAYKNMYAAGFINADEYTKILNEDFFKAYYQSPKIAAANSQIQKEFFNNQDIYTLPYKRGCLLAFYLDNAIKHDTRNQHNLHDFLLEMLDNYYENDQTLTENFDFFVKNLEKYMKNRNIAKFIQTHIFEGQAYDPNTFVLPGFWTIVVGNDGIPTLSLNKSAKNWDGELSK